MTRRRVAGQSLVEFALVFPIFLLMLFGLIDIGRFVYTTNALNQAAREGARFGSVASWAAGCAGTRESCVRQETVDRLAGVVVKPSDVTVTCWRQNLAQSHNPISSVAVSECRTNDLLKVEVKSKFQILTPIIGQFIGTTIIPGSASVMVSQ